MEVCIMRIILEKLAKRQNSVVTQIFDQFVG